MCTVNKSVHTKKVWKLIECTSYFTVKSGWATGGAHFDSMQLVDQCSKPYNIVFERVISARVGSSKWALPSFIAFMIWLFQNHDKFMRPSLPSKLYSPALDPKLVIKLNGDERIPYITFILYFIVVF